MLTCLLTMTISMPTERKEMQNVGPNSGMHPICVYFNKIFADREKRNAEFGPEFGHAPYMCFFEQSL